MDVKASKARSTPVFARCVAGGRRAFGEVRVAEVEAEADAGEVPDPDDLDEVLGFGHVVGQVLEQDFDAERTGEGLQVLDCGERIVERARAPLVVFGAEVQDAGLDRNLLGGFERALYLVHGGDASGLLRVDEVQRRGRVAAPGGFVVGREERHVQRGRDGIRPEPGCDFANGVAVGVIEVMARREELDGLRAGGAKCVEQRGRERLRQKDVRRDSGLHRAIEGIADGRGCVRGIVHYREIGRRWRAQDG